MSDYNFLGIFAGLLSFLAYSLYIFSTIKGKTKPSRVTWWVLTLEGIMISASYYASGARETIWISFSYVLGSLIIALLSLRYGDGKWQKFDTYCLSTALASGLVWYLTASPIFALVVNVFMDFVGLLPTIKKSYLKPIREDKRAWALESFADMLNVLAIEKWTFSIGFYPVYLLIMNTTITVLLFRKQISNYAKNR